MLNHVVCVGRLIKDVEIKELESGRKIANITLAIPRSLKNADGEYDTDFINVTLWNGIAENIAGCCKKGDILGINGRLQKSKEDDNLQMIAEKVTFLSNKKVENEE